MAEQRDAKAQADREFERLIKTRRRLERNGHYLAKPIAKRRWYHRILNAARDLFRTEY